MGGGGEIELLLFIQGLLKIFHFTVNRLRKSLDLSRFIRWWNILKGKAHLLNPESIYGSCDLLAKLGEEVEV